jgi:predicted amidohydrolase
MLTMAAVLYNTSKVVGPEGYIGKYRKTHLWDLEQALYDEMLGYDASPYLL